MRDSSRLSTYVEKRGSKFFTIDLPSFGKHFDQCLAKGILTRSGLPCSKGFHPRSPIPRLFREMVMMVFNVDGVLRDDCDHTAITLLRQLYYGAKKVKMECANEQTFSEVRSFYTVDCEVRLPSLDWGDRGGFRDCGAKVDLRQRYLRSYQDLFALLEQEDPVALSDGQERMGVIQQVADIISATLGVYTPSVTKPRHGPGAVADLRLGRDSKYLFPTWSAKLESVFPCSEFGFPNYRAWVDWLTSQDTTRFREEEVASRLIAVPKTQKGPRLIASEPTANQWCQQAIEEFLQSGVERTPLRGMINFFDQTPNQRRALRASQDGGHCTIDLSSASDRVSCWLVERIFRRNESLLEAFAAVRTLYISNDIDRMSPKIHRIRKFTTMGSALTFPVQSYIYAIIAIGTMLYEQRAKATIAAIRDCAKEAQVFGDDIILPNAYAGAMIRNLEDLGFKVNTTKTFYTGKFRESCGVDAFGGTNVTPAYILSRPDRSSPESMLSVIASHNNFAKRGYWRVCAYLEMTVRKEWPFLAVPYEPVGSPVTPSLWTNGYSDRSHLRSRWNRQLHRREYLTHRLITKVVKGPQGGDSSLLQYFTEEPAPTDKWKAGVNSRPTVKTGRRWAHID
nr:MAG: putative replicase protein [Leviviridae sp.]